MDLHDILKRVYRSFFVIWSLISLNVCIYALIFRWETIIVDLFFALFFVAFLTSLTYAVHYSRRELTIRQYILRSVVQFFVIMAIVLGVGYYVGWVTRLHPIYTVATVISVVVIFIAVAVLEMFQTRRLADKLNLKLQERSEE